MTLFITGILPMEFDWFLQFVSMVWSVSLVVIGTSVLGIVVHGLHALTLYILNDRQTAMFSWSLTEPMVTTLIYGMMFFAPLGVILGFRIFSPFWWVSLIVSVAGLVLRKHICQWLAYRRSSLRHSA